MCPEEGPLLGVSPFSESFTEGFTVMDLSLCQSCLSVSIQQQTSGSVLLHNLVGPLEISQYSGTSDKRLSEKGTRGTLLGTLPIAVLPLRRRQPLNKG